MIRADFRQRARTLICDLHGVEQEFPLLRDLMLEIFQRARQARVFRVELITGRGQLELPLPLSHRETLLKRLLQIPYISHIDEEEAWSASAVVFYLSPRLFSLTNKQLRHRMKGYREPIMEKNASQNDLKKLMKDLKSEEDQSRLEELKARSVSEEVRGPSKALAELEAHLEESWDEAYVTNLLQQLEAHRQTSLISEVLDMIRDFEVFFSEEFRTTYSYYANRFDY